MGIVFQQTGMVCDNHHMLTTAKNNSTGMPVRSMALHCIIGYNGIINTEITIAAPRSVVCTMEQQMLESAIHFPSHNAMLIFA